MSDVQKTAVYWDFFMATGFHMIVLCVFGMVKVEREKIIAHFKKEKDSMKTITFIKDEIIPNSDPQKVITEACNTMECVSENFYDLLVRHTTDLALCIDLKNKTVK